MTYLECLVGGFFLIGLPLGIVIFADVVTDIWMKVKDWVEDE